MISKNQDIQDVGIRQGLERRIEHLIDAVVNVIPEA